MANAEALKFQAFEKPMELIYICGRKSSSEISCSDFLAAHHVKEGKAYFIKISHQTYANYNRKEIIYIKLKINSNGFFLGTYFNFICISITHTFQNLHF